MHALWHIVFPAGIDSLSKDFATRAMPVYGMATTASGEQTDLGAWSPSRHTITLPAGASYSSGSYYNAFQAAYWAHWTNVKTVTLTGMAKGTGTVRVLVSDSKAKVTELVSIPVNDGQFSFTTSIEGMDEGGCLWFEAMASADGPLTLSDAAWGTDASEPRHGTISMAITTMNKPEWCIRQFNVLADAGNLDLIDAVYVIDQGTRLVQDEPGFAEASSRLDGRLHIIRQRNIGGSGGFARGMAEVSQRNDSGYALLLDDDTVLEPESIARALAFANHCERPTIVGGNMLFLTEPTRICAMAETFNRDKIFWEPTPGSPKFADLANSSFIETPYLHQRWDADYNAWWMCLIPVETIRKIGLAYPFFIKNDDVEYGVRAQMAGYPTVTVPGVCLWHQSWVDKDDILDWQAYFHVRNKLIMGLLYSRHPWGGMLLPLMMRASLSATVKMRYSAVKLHRMAVADVLQGAEYIGDILESRLPEIRQARGQEQDAQTLPLDQLPDTLRVHSETELVSVDDSRHALAHAFASLPRRNRRTVIDGYVEPMKVWWLVEDKDSADDAHDAERAVPGTDFDVLTLVADEPSKHWRAMARMDSAVAVNRENGTGVLLVRRPWKAFTGLVNVAVSYARLGFRWRKYQSAYRKAFAEMVSPQWWHRYFDRPVE